MEGLGLHPEKYGRSLSDKTVSCSSSEHVRDDQSEHSRRLPYFHTGVGSGKGSGMGRIECSLSSTD